MFGLKKIHFFLAIFLAACLAVLIWLIVQGGWEKELPARIMSLMDQYTPAPLFILGMFTLPLLGFPITLFLVIAGVKFGIAQGMLLWIVTLFTHSLLSFHLGKRLRSYLSRLSLSRGYRIPALPEKNKGLFSFLFLAVPGPPYALKNYFLPMAGAPFSHCVLLNTAVQYPQGIPFVILGESVSELNLKLFYLVIFLFLVLFLGLRILKNRYKPNIPSSQKNIR